MATINDYLDPACLVDQIRTAASDDESISLEKQRVRAGSELNVSMGILSILQNLDQAFAGLVDLSGNDPAKALVSITTMIDDLTLKLGVKIRDVLIPAAEELGLDRHKTTDNN